MSDSVGHIRPLRIALVITELYVGGAERALVNLVTGLDRKRYSPIVYSLAPSPDETDNALVRRLCDADVPVRFLNVTAPWRFFSAVRRLRGLLIEQAPCVLQTFLYHANVVGALAGRRAGVPAIVSGVRVSEPKRCRLRVERAAMRRVDRVVCVSESVAQTMRAKTSLPKEKLQVICNGIDASRYPTATPADLSQFGIAAPRRVIVCVGRLTKQKGVDWLLDRAPRMLAALPDHDILLVGRGPQRKRLEATVASAGLTGRIHFAGWRPDVAEILLASDLLVLPSRWEGMPNILLEAMAAGIPLLAAQVSGVEEILGPLAAQQSVALYDADGFTSRVVTICQDRELADTLARENRRRVVEHFSLPGMIAAYERLYDELSTAKS